MRVLSDTAGFALPTVLITSVVMLLVLLSALGAQSSVSASLSGQYQAKLARTAAESGASMAKMCLKNSNYIQTWGSTTTKPLTQKTDCNGDTLTSAPDYIVNTANYRTSFIIGNVQQQNGTIIVNIQGKVEFLSSSSGNPAGSQNSDLRLLVTPDTLTATKSTSGTSKTCAIVNSQLFCWGANNTDTGEDFSGNLGDGTTTNSLTPVRVLQEEGVLAGKKVDDVVSAEFHSCALATGKMYCWGRNDAGQLGNSSTATSLKPVLVTGALSGKTVTAIGATSRTTCAIAESKLYCWGDNAYGTVGVNSTTSYFTTPQLVSTTDLGTTYSATKISTSGSRSRTMCAIVDGKAWCWGRNDVGQVGNNTSGGSVLYPRKTLDTGVLAGKTVTSISQDGYLSTTDQSPHVCAVAGGSVYCWGENGDGQLGRGASNTTDSSVPVAVFTGGVLSGKTVTDVAVGLRHSCALASGKIYCWGTRGNGQVGDGYMGSTPAYVPTPVAEQAGALQGQTIAAIGGGANRACAVVTPRTFCWGFNSVGQLGDGTTTTRSVPVESIFLRPERPSVLY